MKTIGQRIKYLREMHKPEITQQNLSHDSGIPIGTISNYELNNRTPSRKALKKIAFALGIAWEKIDPDITKDFLSSLHSETPSCQKICEGLQDEGVLMMHRYKDLDVRTRESINIAVKSEWEKKYGHNPVSNPDSAQHKKASGH